MQRIAALTTALILTLAGPAWAEERDCTPRDTRERAGELAEEIHAATDGDPQKARQIHEELKEMEVAREEDELLRTPQGLEDECARYEQRIEEVEKATEKVD